MAYFCKHIVLLWLIVSTITGILVFGSGFLLRRVEFITKNNCALGSPSDNKGRFTPTGCWMPRRFSKMVFIVIDALRFDFAAFNSTVNQADAKPFENRLPIFQRMISTNPYGAYLYQFVADPPTTTLQRLKALTTGGLPTFVDAGANFASYALNEDNFIYQMVKQKLRLVFMGDDTWVGLFPGKFLRNYSFPSFNVKDLDTVDNGVLARLVPEITGNDWDVIIAHFLGVDHCGHTFGPYHPTMTKKLYQMNEAIRSVIDAIDNDTLLVVMGDHGMTKTGDHGGDSMDEVNAALFLFSKTSFIMGGKQTVYKPVSQIDIVPTLSLLLGLPIPYSNLGEVFANIAYSSGVDAVEYLNSTWLCSLVKALQLNAQQVNDYLQRYMRITKEFDTGRLAQIQSILEDATDTHNGIVHSICSKRGASNLGEADFMEVLKVVEKYSMFLTSCKKMCQAVWARFGMEDMWLGTSIVVMSIVVGFAVYQLKEDKICEGIVSTVIALFNFVYLMVLLFSILLKFRVNHIIACMLIIYSSVTFAGICFWKMDWTLLRRNLRQNLQPVPLCSLIIGLIWLLIHFSNSYTVHEDRITLFLCQTYVWVVGLSCFLKLAKKRFIPESRVLGKKHAKVVSNNFGYILTSPEVMVVCLVLAFSAVLRFALVFKGCREEQWQCERNIFTIPLAAMSEQLKHVKHIRYFFSVVCLWVITICLHHFLRHNGNLNGLTVKLIAFKYGLPAAVVCVMSQWALVGIPVVVTAQWPAINNMILPICVYGLTCVTVLLVFVNPLFMYVVHRNTGKEQPYVQFNENLVPQLFHYMKTQIKNYKKVSMIKELNTDSRIPLVYGLGTAYSSALICIGGFLLVVAALLLNDHLSPSLLLYVLAMFLYLEIHATHVVLCNPKDEKKRMGVPFTTVIGWCLLTSFFYFATGHQHTITTIEWGAAFVGFEGNYERYFVPAVLILYHTFCAYVIGTLALPLLAMWPMMRGKEIYSSCKASEKPEIIPIEKGEYSLFEEGLTLSVIFKLSMAFFNIFAAKTTATLLAAALHRRHLMVWKIFAPRFVFEAVTLLVIALVLVFSFVLVARVHFALFNWTNDLEKKAKQTS